MVSLTLTLSPTLTVMLTLTLIPGKMLCHTALVNALGTHLARSPWFQRRVTLNLIPTLDASAYPNLYPNPGPEPRINLNP